MDIPCGNEYGVFEEKDMRTPGVVTWLETETGERVSTGKEEDDVGYYYSTPDGLFTNIVTADLLLSYVTPDNDPDFIRDVFHALAGEKERTMRRKSGNDHERVFTPKGKNTEREIDFIVRHLSAGYPYILSVPFREVMVSSAWFDDTQNVLHFSLVSSLSPLSSSSSSFVRQTQPIKDEYVSETPYSLPFSEVVLARVPASGIISVSRNGNPFFSFSPLPVECESCWLLKVPTPPSSQLSSDVYLVQM